MWQSQLSNQASKRSIRQSQAWRWQIQEHRAFPSTGRWNHGSLQVDTTEVIGHQAGVQGKLQFLWSSVANSGRETSKSQGPSSDARILI